MIGLQSFTWICGNHVSAGKKLRMAAEFHCPCKWQSQNGISHVELIDRPSIFKIKCNLISVMYRRITKKGKKCFQRGNCGGTCIRETLHSETFVVSQILKKENPWVIPVNKIVMEHLVNFKFFVTIICGDRAQKLLISVISTGESSIQKGTWNWTWELVQILTQNFLC